jgi:hypothetical protein
MATVRTTDIVYRHDESTFCVLLPSTSDAEALAVASRIGVNIEKMPVLSECGVSISAGVASTRVTGGDVRSAVDRALAALGDAVRSGKGPIVADGGDGEPGASDMAPVPRPVRPVPTRIAASRQFAALPTPSAETPFVPPASGPAHVVSRTS